MFWWTPKILVSFNQPQLLIVTDHIERSKKSIHSLISYCEIADLLILKFGRVWIVLNVGRLVVEPPTLIINGKGLELIAPIHLQILLRIPVHSGNKNEQLNRI